MRNYYNYTGQQPARLSTDLVTYYKSARIRYGRQRILTVRVQTSVPTKKSKLSPKTPSVIFDNYV